MNCGSVAVAMAMAMACVGGDGVRRSVFLGRRGAGFSCNGQISKSCSSFSAAGV